MDGRAGVMRLVVVIVLLFGSIARAEAPAEESTLELEITIGRWSVRIDRALEGLDAAVPPLVVPLDDAATTADRLWRQLLWAARDGAFLRSITCAKGQATRRTCRTHALPGWALDPTAPTPTMDSIVRAEAELGEFLEPFIDAGCRAGVKRTKDRMFCSVE